MEERGKEAGGQPMEVCCLARGAVAVVVAVARATDPVDSVERVPWAASRLPPLYPSRHKHREILIWALGGAVSIVKLQSSSPPLLSLQTNHCACGSTLK